VGPNQAVALGPTQAGELIQVRALVDVMLL
jgi:hypothetical protein